MPSKLFGKLTKFKVPIEVKSYGLIENGKLTNKCTCVGYQMRLERS